MGETVDEKAEEEGLGVESIVVGIACDHLVALGCGESNSVCMLYDITDISSPTILKIFHLSEVSRTKNPEQSFRKDLGDIGSETILWIPPSRSPTGNSGFLFGGAISGTLSFYEFKCTSTEDPCFPDGCSSSVSSEKRKQNEGVSKGGVVGIVVGAAVVLAVVLLGTMRLRKTGSKDSDANTDNAPSQGEAA